MRWLCRFLHDYQLQSCVRSYIATARQFPDQDEACHTQWRHFVDESLKFRVEHLPTLTGETEHYGGHCADNRGVSGIGLKCLDIGQPYAKKRMALPG